MRLGCLRGVERNTGLWRILSESELMSIKAAVMCAVMALLSVWYDSGVGWVQSLFGSNSSMGWGIIGRVLKYMLAIVLVRRLLINVLAVSY